MANMRRGSTRIMTAVESGVISWMYKDAWSAFDRGPSEQLIPGIGAARCACAVKSFELAHAAGLPTHFIEQVDPVTIHVREFAIPDTDSLSGYTHGRVLPVELIWRAYVWGSLWERIRANKIDPVSLGFAPGAEVTEGAALPHLLQECTTKFELMDWHLTDEKAQALACLTPGELVNARDLVVQAVEVTNRHFSEADFLCPDGKLELGITRFGEIVLVDVFGTPDENRIIHEATGEIYSKDLIRDHLKKIGWKDKLDAAKASHPADKSKWPPYPELPDELVGLVAERYATVAREYVGA